MKYAFTILTLLLVAVGELHLLWYNDLTTVNWIISEPHPMLLHWNVKYAADGLQWLLVPVMIYTYNKTLINRVTLTTLFVWLAFDFFAYFYNYKTFNYFVIYGWILPLWAVLYILKRPKPCKKTQSGRK